MRRTVITSYWIFQITSQSSLLTGLDQTLKATVIFTYRKCHFLTIVFLNSPMTMLFLHNDAPVVYCYLIDFILLLIVRYFAFEFFTVCTKLAEMANLYSKDLTTAKKTLPPLGLNLMLQIITGLEVQCLTIGAKQACAI